MPWDWVWSRYERATLLGMFGAVLLVPGLITGTVAPAVVGGLLCAAGVGALILPPVVRRHRRQQTWWVLTPDRLGDVCVARPARESWVERGEVEEVLVRGLRADGSGTVVVKVNPRASLRDERVLPISEVVIGRVPGAAELADQIGLLRYDLS